jgi:proteasome lid subunit RPN8/RPN11
MSGAKDFRYLIPESLFKEITQKAAEEYPQIIHGWLFADRKENFGICTKFIMNPDLRKNKVHVKPRSWMRYKKSKIYNMRKFKAELGVDIVWMWHSHPSGNEKLHAIDKRILKYLSNGVMIIVVPPVPNKTPEQKAHLVGWYYDKRYTKKPIIEKMVFEIISE